jgi:hypothetical protein
MKEITRRFDDEDVAAAKNKLALFKDEMPEEDYKFMMNVVDRLARSWRTEEDVF